MSSLLSFVSYSNPTSTSSSIILDAIIVASTCSVVVESTDRGGHLTFPVYDKSVGAQTLQPMDFSLVVYEENDSTPGCSAFDVGSTVSIQFGDAGQLDAQGVVTIGAGDAIRVAVQAVDREAGYQGVLNEMKNTVTYDAKFAVAGEFKYQAWLMNIEHAQAGEYQGSLSFLVTYQ